MNQTPTEYTIRYGFDEPNPYEFIFFFSQPSLMRDF